jgi:AMMECR1 domain-containing protein
MDSNSKLEATKEHCAYCFDVIKGVLEGKFTGKNLPPLPESIPRVESPLFVTWHIHYGKEEDLRGCIGNEKS